MERLTNHFDYCKMIDCKFYDAELFKQEKCKFFDNSIVHCHEKRLNDKLREYEDLEEQLEKVYGEHDGLLETAVKSLVKYNGEKPRKARLLTDEDADRWEEYKKLEEQGMLLRLPCKIGKNLYDITEFIENYDSPDIFLIDTSMIEISKDKEGLIYTIDCVDYREKDFGTTLFTSEEEALKAIRGKGWIL